MRITTIWPRRMAGRVKTINPHYNPETMMGLNGNNWHANYKMKWYKMGWV
jgi:hypothetical protein